MQDITKAFEKGCHSKIKHTTEDAALIALNNIKESKHCIRKVKLQVYKCRFGDHWHVGRKRKNRSVGVR